MASPFAIDLLPRSVRAAFPAIEAGVSRGLSTSAITKTIRAAGIRTSAQSVGTAVRLIQRTRQQEQRIIRRAANRPIQVDRLPVALTNIKRNVSYTVDLSFLHPDSGQRLNRTITVSTDRTDLTPSQIVEEATEIFNNVENYEGVEVVGGTVTGGKKSPTFDN